MDNSYLKPVLVGLLGIIIYRFVQVRPTGEELNLAPTRGALVRLPTGTTRYTVYEPPNGDNNNNADLVRSLSTNLNKRYRFSF